MSYSAPFPGKEWELTAACFSDGRLKYDDGLVFAKYSLAKAWDAFELYLTPGAVKGRILLVDED
jgi:L-iditol 2-dehydrogenase